MDRQATNEFKETELLLVSRIKESETNHRVNVESQELRELRDSIEQVGLIQPVVVKEVKLKKYDYEIVAGSRRFAACKLLKMEHIPGIIMSGSESDFEKVQIIENCQRKDVTPVEEHHAFLSLYKKGMTADDIAVQIGKSRPYVYDRMNVSRLNDEAIVHLHAGLLNMSQARELMKIPKELQEKVLNTMALKNGDAIIEFRPTKDFRQEVFSSYKLDLKNAIFDTEKDDLIPEAPSCKECPFRSADQTLFAHEYDNNCYNRDCNRKKTEAELAVREKQFISQGLEVVKATQMGWHDYDKENEYVFYFQLTEVPEDVIKAGYKVSRMALICNGTQLGESYPVYTEAELEEIRQQRDDNAKANSEQFKLENKTKHKVIQNVIFKLSEKFTSAETPSNPDLVKKMLIHRLWDNSNMDDLKQVCKRLKWTVKDEENENELIDYKKLDYSNYWEFYTLNINKLNSEALTEVINWMMLADAANGEYNYLIMSEATKEKIDLAKILEEENKANKTQVKIEDVISLG